MLSEQRLAAKMGNSHLGTERREAGSLPEADPSAVDGVACTPRLVHERASVRR